MHGSIGFTWEHPAHLHHRRTTSTELLLEPPRGNRGAVVTLLAAS